MSFVLDINECEDKNGDCQHECLNTLGSYTCRCQEGYRLRPDNRTCELLQDQEGSPGDLEAQAASGSYCYASCDTVHRLNERIRRLQEEVSRTLYNNSFFFTNYENNIKEKW